MISPVIVEPYNCILGTHSNLEHTHCEFLVDNEAISNICEKRLHSSSPSYKIFNPVIAHFISAVTASLRYDGKLNASLAEFHTNLVPFPCMHFPHVSYAPLYSVSESFHKQSTVSELTEESFYQCNQMIKCKMDVRNHLSCCLMYRGDVVAKDVNEYIATIKAQGGIQFIETCPSGLKVSIIKEKPTVIPGSNLAIEDRAVCKIANNTSVVEAWDKLTNKFDILYSKRAFLHKYLEEGMEEHEFLEAREDLRTLENDYKKVCKSCPDETGKKRCAFL